MKNGLRYFLWIKYWFYKVSKQPKKREGENKPKPTCLLLHVFASSKSYQKGRLGEGGEPDPK